MTQKRNDAWWLKSVKTIRQKILEGANSAIDKAITEIPDSFIIMPFLEAHKAEVKGMSLTKYNEAEQMQLFKEGISGQEAYEYGF